MFLHVLCLDKAEHISSWKDKTKKRIFPPCLLKKIPMYNVEHTNGVHNSRYEEHSKSVTEDPFCSHHGLQIGRKI